MRFFNNPDYWRERAARVRAIADQMSDKETTRVMLDTARDYDELVLHLERWLKGHVTRRSAIL